MESDQGESAGLADVNLDDVENSDHPFSHGQGRGTQASSHSSLHLSLIHI